VYRCSTPVGTTRGDLAAFAKGYHARRRRSSSRALTFDTMHFATTATPRWRFVLNGAKCFRSAGAGREHHAVLAQLGDTPAASSSSAAQPG